MNRTDTDLRSPVLPLVSVVIPTRNRASLVVRAIASVLEQTYTNFEVIVVVDGADDATEAAVKAIHDRRIRCVVLGEPVGGSEARNRGISAAQSEWIALLDDDDEWLPTKLEKQIDLARNSAGRRVVISCQIIGRYPSQDYLWPRRTPAAKEPICEYLFNRRTWFRGEGQLQTSTLLVPRSLMQELPFTRGLSKHQDTDWYVRVGARKDVSFRFVLEPLAIWHLGEARSTVVSQCRWTRSWRWLASIQPKLTRRAYAGFIATQLIGEAAAQGRGLNVAPFLLLEDVHRRPPRPDGPVSFYWKRRPDPHSPHQAPTADEPREIPAAEGRNLGSAASTVSPSHRCVVALPTRSTEFILTSPKESKMTDHNADILVPGIPVSDISPENVRFLGMTLHPHSLIELNVLVARGIVEDRRWVIANHNLHSLFLMYRSARVREFYDKADWTAIDGMPIVALARLYGYRLSRDQRVTYADWMMPLMELCAANGWRVFYLGSGPGVAERGRDCLCQQFKNLQMVTHDGYFDAKPASAENSAVLGEINDYDPDILLVGMGMPRQELWIQENRGLVKARILLPAGAAMDYIAGEVPTPPRWSGRLGLEWAFRLVHEPKRLFSRYMVEPWYILGLLCADHVKRTFQFRRGVREA